MGFLFGLCQPDKGDVFGFIDDFKSSDFISYFTSLGGQTMTTQTTNRFSFTLEDEAKMVETLQGAIKFDKASGSRYLHPIIAEELAKVFLHDFMRRVEDETRQMQTREILHAG